MCTELQTYRRRQKQPHPNEYSPKMLLSREKITKDLIYMMISWQQTGFNIIVVQ